MWRTTKTRETKAPTTPTFSIETRTESPRHPFRLRAFYVAVLAALAIPFFGLACSEDFTEADQPGTDDSAATESLVPMVTITDVPGNPTCGDFDPDLEELRIDESEIVNGMTYVSDDGYLEVTITDYTGQSFDWSSNEGVDSVFVKGGPNGRLYEYNPEATSGDDLTAPINPNNNNPYGISHISFCYDVEFARISIEPDDVNEVGDNHTFTVTVEQKIGFDGIWGPVADGTLVDVSFTDEHGAVTQVVSDDCANPGTASGTCEVEIVSDTAGTITAHAESTPNVGGSLIFVETDGTGENSDDAIKRYVDAYITIGDSETNLVGDPHTFTVNAYVDEGKGNGFQPVPDGTVINVTYNDINGATSTETADTCATGTTGGSCQVTIESNTTGQTIATATMNLTIDGSPEIAGDIIVTRSTDGTGSNTGPATKIWVDATISITPDDTNGIGEYHTFTVAVHQDIGDGAGLVDVPDGTDVDVTLTPSGGATVLDLTDNCEVVNGTGGTVNGECTVSFRSDTAGTIVGTAEATLNLAGLQVTVATNGTGDISGPATKIYLDGSLIWRKIDGDTQELLGGATFELCRTHDWNSATMTYDDITDVCVSVTDNSAPDADPDDGEFLVEDLILGRYTLRETAAPEGYEFDETDIRTVDLSTTTTSHDFGDFLNFPEDEDEPPEVSGCTPGFWKNHTELWDEPSDPIAAAAGFTTDTDFHTFFNLTPAQTGLPADLTMEEAINLGGGHAKKLARHAVAALLNSATGFAYDYEGDLYTDIRQAFIDGQYEPLATMLDQANNAGCLVDTNNGS